MGKIYYYSMVLAVAGLFITPGRVYSGTPPQPSTTVPTLGEWGMIWTAIILGIAGLYKIFRSK